MNQPPDPFPASPSQNPLPVRQWSGDDSDRRLLNKITTPGWMVGVVATIVGLMLAVLFGALIGYAEMQTVGLLAAGFLFAFLLVAAGDYWWALLVMLTTMGVQSTSLGFRMTGFELGSVVVTTTCLIQMALRAMRPVRPAVGLSLVFWALAFYLLLHAAFVVTYHRYEDPVGLKNIIRGYYRVLAPLCFFYLLGKYCHPRTVRPVILWFLGVTVVITIISIPVWIFQIQFDLFQDSPVTINWLDPEFAQGALRQAPILTALGIAFWPAASGFVQRARLAGLIGLSLIAGAASSGRLALVGCFLVVMVFMILNRKWWAFAAACAALAATSAWVSLAPDSVTALPYTAQRALSGLDFSGSGTEAKQDTAVSDRWHHELRSDSIDYWMETPATFFLGHGFGAWDESLNRLEGSWTGDFEYAKKMAIRMGATENAFSGITNTLGLVGLLLYLGFIFSLGRQLMKARKKAAKGSFARAMCEFSLVNLAVFLILSLVQGGPPAWETFYWLLGLLAARPLLGKEPAKEEQKERIAPRRMVPARAA